MNSNNFTGKTVFITGAGSGIGYQTAIAFAEKGANIIACDVSPEGLVLLGSEVVDLGVSYTSFSFDVTDEEKYRSIVKGLGERNIIPDIVINNAGLGFIRDFLSLSMDEWRTTFDVNVMGVVFGCRFFSDLWKERGMAGHLVNLSSMAAYTPAPNMTAYAASKYAVEGLSSSLNLEFADTDIQITCIHPGVINTPIVHNPDHFSFPKEQTERLQKHYREKGASPRSVADDIVRGVETKAGTVLTGPGTTFINLMKRLLPKSVFLKIILNESRKIGLMPQK